MCKIVREISCGAFICENGKVLLVKSKEGKHWDFPKGHMEEGETKQQTAIREVFEETGLRIRICNDDEYEISYNPKPNVLKTVVFFEAEKIDGNEKKQESEIEETEWLDYKQAVERLTFETNKNIFKKFLDKKNIL